MSFVSTTRSRESDLTMFAMNAAFDEHNDIVNVVGFSENNSNNGSDPCAPIVDIDTIFDDDEEEDAVTIPSSSFHYNKADAFQPMPLQDVILSSGMFDLRDDFKFHHHQPTAPADDMRSNFSYYQHYHHNKSIIPSDDILSDVLDELDHVTCDLRPEEIAPMSMMQQQHQQQPLIMLPTLCDPVIPAPQSFKHLLPCPKPKRRVVSDESAASSGACNVNSSLSIGNNHLHHQFFEDRASIQVKRQIFDEDDSCQFVVKRQRLLDDDPATAYCGGEDDSDEQQGGKFRLYQAEKWHQKFQELINYKNLHGHAQVPHGYRPNPTLARWAKRQRYQYKLFQENKPSTMTDERVAALEALGFVWDSHSALWEERYNELKEFVRMAGHANVPSIHPPNPKLAIWVKCQRRQYKLLLAGEASNITQARVDLLNQLNFVWEIRRGVHSS